MIDKIFNAVDRLFLGKRIKKMEVHIRNLDEETRREISELFLLVKSRECDERTRVTAVRRLQDLMNAKVVASMSKAELKP